MRKPMWKVTFTYLSLNLLPYYMATGKKPPTWTKVYRWKWRAKLAAMPGLPIAGHCITAKVEPYWPDADNVIPLRAA